MDREEAGEDEDDEEEEADDDDDDGGDDGDEEEDEDNEARVPLSLSCNNECAMRRTYSSPIPVKKRKLKRASRGGVRQRERYFYARYLALLFYAERSREKSTSLK